MDIEQFIDAVEKRHYESAKEVQRLMDKNEELCLQMQSTNHKIDKMAELYLSEDKHKSECKICNLTLKQEVEKFSWDNFASIKEINNYVDKRIEEKKEKQTNNLSTKTAIVLNVITILGAILGSTILKLFMNSKGN
jgi:hypothetical protein